MNIFKQQKNTWFGFKNKILFTPITNSLSDYYTEILLSTLNQFGMVQMYKYYIGNVATNVFLKKVEKKKHIR